MIFLCKILCPCLSRFTGWFLLKFLSVILHSVLVHKGQMAVLKKAADVRIFLLVHFFNIHCPYVSWFKIKAAHSNCFYYKVFKYH